MRPMVVLHNSISADGATTGFEPDMGLHYEVAGRYGAEAHLIGSATALTGIEQFVESVPAEIPEDMARRTMMPEDPRPIWVFPDSRGALQGLLHVFRRFEHCRDVVVMVTAATPAEYLDYLRDREYDFHLCGDDRVDLAAALGILAEQYGVKTVLVDSGPTLNGLLLNQGQVDEVSLLVSPFAVGQDSLRLFGNLDRCRSLELAQVKALGTTHVHLVYRVPKRPSDNG